MPKQTALDTINRLIAEENRSGATRQRTSNTINTIDRLIAEEEENERRRQEWVQENQYGPYGDERDRATSRGVSNAPTPVTEYRGQQAEKSAAPAVGRADTLPELQRAVEAGEMHPTEAASRYLGTLNKGQAQGIQENHALTPELQAEFIRRNSGQATGTNFAPNVNLQYQMSQIANRGRAEGTNEEEVAAWVNSKADQYQGIRNNKDYLENTKADEKYAIKGPYLATGKRAKYNYITNLNGFADRENASPHDNELNKYSFMTDNERKDYTYIANTQGLDAAEGYLDYLDYDLNARATDAAQARWAENAQGTGNAIGASATSVLANSVAGLGELDLLRQNINKAFTGKPVDYNAPALSASKYTQTVRGQVAKDIEEAHPNATIAGVNLGSFLYQTGMSMADSAVVALLGRFGVPNPGVILGSSAAVNATLNAKERGLTDAQALTTGLASGIAEMLFESVSLEKIIHPTTAKGAGGVILNILRQAFTEGSEEVATTLANTLTDSIINGDKSEILVRQRALQADGMSEEAARKQAWKEWGAGLLTDLLGGAISGGVMGTGANVSNYMSEVNYRMTGDAYRQMGMTNDEFRDALVNVKENTYDPYTEEWLDKLTDRAARGEDLMKKLPSADIGKVMALQAGLTNTVLTQTEYNRIARLNESPYNNVTDEAPQTTQETQDAARVAEAPLPARAENAAETKAGQLTLPTAEEAPARNAPATLTLPTVAEQQERSTPPVPQQAAQERETPQTLTAPTVAERQERETPQTLTLPTVENRTAETEEQMIERLKKSPAGLAQDDYTATLDQRMVKVLDTLAKKLGLRVAFADEVNRGKANADITGNVVLLEKGNPNPVRFLIGHEATHWMKRNADGGYNAFEKAARKADAVWFANREAEIRRVYQQQGINIDDAGIREEAVSDYAGLLADNSDTLERFITENKDDRGALEKVRDFFRHVKEFLTGDERAKVERAERRLLQALQQTERNVAGGKGAYQGNNTQQSIKSNIDGTQAAGYNNELTGGVQNGRAQEGTAAGAELDGTSGEGIPERRLLAGRGELPSGRLLRQGDISDSGIVRLSDSSRQLLNDRSVGTVEMEYSTDHAAFSALLDEARAVDRENGWAVTPKTVEELENCRTFLSEDRGVGFALAPNGDIEAVFRNRNRHPQRGAMKSVLPQAIANGGTKLDCYGPILAKVYAEAGGMVPVCRVSFNPEYANEGWTADKGEPDIVFMMVTDTDPDTIIQKQGTYHLPTVEEIAELPLFTGPTGYDDAAAYRDRLLEERIGTGNTEGETKMSLKGLDADAIPESIQRYGRIKLGEKPARDVQVPKKVTEDKSERVSRTIRTVLEAGATPDTAVPTISELVEKGAYSYQVYSDKDAIAKAEDTIKDKGWEATLTEWVKDVSDGMVNKTNTALGWALYNNAANKGDLDTALNVLDLIVRHQRNAAQAVQATRILKKLTPEAQLYGVQRSVDNLIAEIKQKYGKDVDIQVNRDLARAFLNAETEAERRKALEALYKDVGRQLPSRFIDKWNAWRYLAMLGNPRTHVRNIVGNAGFAPVVLVKDQIGTMLESIAYRLSNGKTERTKGLVLPGWDHKLVKAAWNRYDDIMDEALGGGKYTDVKAANDAIQQGRVIFKFKPLEAARRFNSAALDKEDVWFNKPHYVYAMAQYCKANDITPAQIASGKGLEKAEEYAIKEAQKATYRDINAFSNFVSSIGRSTDRKTPVGKVASAVIEGILPFRRTPANILARGVEYSPLGLAKSLTYDMYQVMQKDADGNPRMTVSEMLDNVSAGLTGTGLLALGMLLSKLGLLRGHGEDDEKARNFDDLTGHQNYALQLPNGDSYTLDWLAPEALPVFVGVNLYERMLKTKGEMKMNDLLKAVSSISEPMLEMSMLQGINDLLETVSFAKNQDTSALFGVLSEATISYLTQAFPTLLGQSERTGENIRMTTYTDKNKWLMPDIQYSLGKVSAKTPGWDYDQIPYIDAWGRTEVTGDGWVERAFKNMINPGYTDKVRMSDMEKELLRLYNLNPDDNGGVLPTRPGRKIGDTDLTGEQYVKYATKKGQLSYELATGIVKSEAYKKATDDERVAMIKDAFDYANEKGRAAAIPGYKPSKNKKWMAAMDQTVKETKVDKAAYISARYAAGQIEGLKDDNGETITNSAGLKKMAYLYGLTDLTTDQREAMMADFGVGKTLLETVQSKDDVKGMLEFIDADIPASEYKDYKIASGVRGIDLNLYMKGYNAYYDADGSGTKTNADWTAVLDKQTFSKDEAQDSYIKGVLWQLYTNSTSTKNNPYDKSGGQYVLDEKDKAKSGGSGSGQYARANLPTLKLPTVEPVRKRNTGRLELPTI